MDFLPLTALISKKSLVWSLVKMLGFLKKSLICSETFLKEIFNKEIHTSSQFCFLRGLSKRETLKKATEMDRET